VSQNPNGDDELGQHIEKLESMLGKAEITPFELQDLKKTLNDIRSLQVSINLTKSMESIKNVKMGKLNKSQAFSPRAIANLPEQSKKALTLQEKIVADVFTKWAKDESQASSAISSILNVDGITKKD
jgi:ABC-type phosphate/phosphonate transport system ATPase subunit